MSDWTPDAAQPSSIQGSDLPFGMTLGETPVIRVNDPSTLGGYDSVVGQVLGIIPGQAVVVRSSVLGLGQQTRATTLLHAVRIAAITSVEHGPVLAPPDVLVRTYQGKQQSDTTPYFTAEASVLGRVGYEVSTQSWAPGQWGAGAFVVALVACIFLIGFLIFAYLLIVKPDGTLTALIDEFHAHNLARPEGFEPPTL